MSKPSDHYNPLAKGLHWLSAAIMLGLLPLGFYMVSLEFSPFKLDLYWWHKSFGTLIFFLVILRFIWRFIKKPPPHLDTHAPWERTLAKIIHVLLYAAMIGMPISGILMSAASDYPRPFFGLFEIPDIVEGKNETLFNRMRLMHEFFSYLLLVAVGLHGLGAFKHHFIDKDTTLKRMVFCKAKRFGTSFLVLIFVSVMGSTSYLAAQHIYKEYIQVNSEAPLAVRAKEQDYEASSSEVSQHALPSWEIILEQSNIGFKALVQGDEFKGQFIDFEGVIVFDPDNLDGSFADINVRIDSVSSDSSEKDGYIVLEPWLFAESFPESNLKTTKIEKTDENQYVAYADLTLRGVTLPVQVPFSLVLREAEGGKRRADMSGSFEIKRLDFGIGEGDWASPEMVENALSISVSIHAKEL